MEKLVYELSLHNKVNWPRTEFHLLFCSDLFLSFCLPFCGLKRMHSPEEKHKTYLEEHIL